MDPSVPSVPLPTQVACRKDQEPGQFKAYYQEMLDRSPLLPVGRGVEIMARNLQTKMQLLPETWETASPTTP